MPLSRALKTRFSRSQAVGTPAAALASTDARDIARALCAEMLSVLARKDPALASDLRDLADRILAPVPYSQGESDPQAAFASARMRGEMLHAQCEALAAGAHVRGGRKMEARRRALAGAWARVGKLIELSGHLACENFFDMRRARRDEMLRAFNPDRGDRPPVLAEADMVPGGIERTLYLMKDPGGTHRPRRYVFRSAHEAVNYLNLPVFVPVLTQHPTNLDTLATSRLLRAVYNAARAAALRGGDGAALRRLRQELAAFTENELTPLDTDGRPRNFSPSEETAFVLDIMEHMFRNLDIVYGTFDQALARRWGKKYDARERKRFRLNYQLVSWAMGDKDGNSNIRAEHLLEAVMLQRRLALQLTREELRILPPFPGAAACGAWENAFETAENKLAAQLQALRLAREESDGVDIPLPQSRFDTIAAGAQNIVVPPGAARPVSFAQAEDMFAGALSALFDKAGGKQQGAVLSLLRRTHTFGLQLGRIELRETANEYSRTVAHLLAHHPLTGKKLAYLKMTERERARLLDKLASEHPEELAKAAQKFLSSIEETAALRAYDPKDPQIIAYHTLKRLQIAAQNAGMFTDMILAECRGTHHMMEALALQRAVSPALRLHITPLLEEYETLNNAGAMLVQTLQHASYRRHLMACANGDPAAIVQRIQVAHSDNVRRAGTAAARSNIHLLHHDVPAHLMQKRAQITRLFAADGVDTRQIDITVQWFEGGSMSDALRGGVRSFTATINAFGLHHYTKATFQGGDLHNFFNTVSSFRRILLRTFTHCAKELALGTGTVARNDAVERAVKGALEKCYADYTARHFNVKANPIGCLFAHPLVNYPLYTIIGNRASRSATRIAAGDEAVYAHPRRGTVPVRTDKIRTIGFSNNLNEANIQGSWLSGQNMSDYLARALRPGSAGGQALQRAAGGRTMAHKNRRLTAAGARTLYALSPSFRDVVDFMGYGLIVSDIGRLQQRLAHAAKESGIPLIGTIKKYVYDTLPRDYAAAAELVLAALGQLPPARMLSGKSAGKAPDAQTCARLCHDVAQRALAHLADEIGVKHDFVTLLEVMRDNVLTQAWREGRREPNVAELATLSDIASGMAIYRHGRIFAADDPHYGTELRRHRAAMQKAS
ncbi:MAG: phosphoenolpyruvate carboxylase [Alphaproteobacteria bacterium]|nr:phosphoenolpyruvate carboxylase [Alphaproteobacteria bacterium]